MELDRNGLLVYLSNLKLLETAIYTSQTKKEKMAEEMEKIKSNSVYPSIPVKLSPMDFTGAAIFCFIVSILGILCDLDSFLTKIIGWMLLPVPFLMVIATISEKKQTKEKNKELQRSYNSQREAVDKYISKNQSKVDDYPAVHNALNTEIAELKNMLNNAYSLNIIPLQFRNIQGIYYLYDYISTSNESLTNALMQANLEAIKQKLDKMISLQGEMLIRQAQANNMIFEQNRQMISSLQNIEVYSKISAINSELSVKMQSKQLAYQRAEFWLQ